jgi:hypothetical protein
MVHGNKVNAELLPWHFNANMLNTIFRFVAEFNFLDPTRSGCEAWRHDAQDFFITVTRSWDWQESLHFDPATALHECFVQHAFFGALQVELVSSVTLPFRE